MISNIIIFIILWTLLNTPFICLYLFEISLNKDDISNCDEKLMKKDSLTIGDLIKDIGIIILAIAVIPTIIIALFSELLIFIKNKICNSKLWNKTIIIKK